MKFISPDSYGSSTEARTPHPPSLPDIEITPPMIEAAAQAAGAYFPANEQWLARRIVFEDFRQLVCGYLPITSEKAKLLYKAPKRVGVFAISPKFYLKVFALKGLRRGGCRSHPLG